MSSGRKENFKRKFNWNGGENGVKRFHGTKQKICNAERRNGGSRWEQGRHTRSQSEFPNSHHRLHYSWRAANRNNYTKYNSSNNQEDYQQRIDFTSPVLSEPTREHEEHLLSGPGSETERMERILATKKRIEEALASKSTIVNSQEIPFHNSLKEMNKDKTNDKSLPLSTNLELRLTNSDFKEIGSVASCVGATEGAEGETESSGDLVLNLSTCSSQQRSFNNTIQNTISLQAKTPPRSGGWSMSPVSEIASSEPVQSTTVRGGGEPIHSSLVRGGGEMYFQESREKILGSIQPSAEEQDVDKSLNPSTSSQKHSPRNDFSRVGQLYQSFLKSRLFGYTLKMKNKQKKSIGPNPLLNKSVLDNQSTKETMVEMDKELELEIPRPILIKLEESNVNNTLDIAAEEANEFCKEYSYLLTHPNFLIPPENLEKLGLGHLTEMNKLLDERRSTPEYPLQNCSPNNLRVRSLNAIDNSKESDIIFNQTLDNFGFGSTDSANLNSSNLNATNLNSNSAQMRNSEPQQPGSSTSIFQDNQSSPISLDPQYFNKQNSISVAENSVAADMQAVSVQNISVDSVVEKVVEKLLKASNVNSQTLNTRMESVINNRILKQSFLPNQSVSPDMLNSTSPGPASSTQPSSNQLQDISGKMLTLFLIDKQIEELRQEKMKIYSELLSSKVISSTLFNSWAQDQIQQGNVMSVIANTSNNVPELARVINNTVPEQNLSYPSHNPSFNDNCIHESVSELVSLKNEMVDSKLAACQNSTVEPFHDNNVLNNIKSPDSIILIPNNSFENNRPKLSVRKDLHDPNSSNRSLITCDLSSVNKQTQLTPEVRTKIYKTDPLPDVLNTESIDFSNKRKKFKKKEPALDVVNLVDDTTTDEEPCNISKDGSVSAIESLASEDTSSRISSENNIKSEQPPKKKSSKIKFHLHNNTVTCMTVLKRALILGSKEGLMMVFSVTDGNQEFQSQLHIESIMCISTHQKCIITGSADSTICVFSLEKHSKTQTVQLSAPVQCFDVQFSRVYVGTKNGFFVTYKINVVEDTDGCSRISLELTNEPMKLTNSSILAIKAAKVESLKVLIVASRGEQITVRDIRGVTLTTFDWCDTVNCLQLYKESPFVFCGTNTNSVKVVNFVTGENSEKCVVGRSAIHIVFLQSVMFAACGDAKVYIYDVEDKMMITSVNLSKGNIMCIAIAKQKIIVANSRDDLQVIPFPPVLKIHLKKKKN